MLAVFSVDRGSKTRRFHLLGLFEASTFLLLKLVGFGSCMQVAICGFDGSKLVFELSLCLVCSSRSFLVSLLWLVLSVLVVARSLSSLLRFDQNIVISIRFFLAYPRRYDITFGRDCQILKLRALNLYVLFFIGGVSHQRRFWWLFYQRFTKCLFALKFSLLSLSKCMYLF